MLNKKNILCTIGALVVAANASAATDGFYVGGQAGVGVVHEKQEINNSKFHNKGLAGRVYTGYQVNQNFAAELGLTKFHNVTETVNAISTKATVKTAAVDLVGKGILPLQNGFGVYGKAGVAYVKQTETVKSGSEKDSASAHKMYPTFGAGVTYSVTQNVDTDLSWTRIQKVGSKSNIPSSDFFGLGVSYHFG